MSGAPAWLVPWIRWKLVGGKRPIGVPKKIPRQWQHARAWFVQWGRWKLAGEVGARPEHAPRRIPQWAQALLAEPEIKRVLGSPPAPPATKRPYLAAHRGAVLNSPVGAGWNFAEMRTAGFDWAAANIGDFLPSQWASVRDLVESEGMVFVPWSRLGHPNHDETKDDCLRRLGELIQVAKEWGTTRPIVNVETEIKPAHLGGLITPEEVARELDTAGMDEAAISTEGWLYDMHWIPLTRYVVLLQILPRDNGWTPAEVKVKQAQCETRAEAYGFEHVGSSVQTYPMADGSQPDPDWFDLEGENRSLIWGDNVGPGEWALWT